MNTEKLLFGCKLMLVSAVSITPAIANAEDEVKAGVVEAPKVARKSYLATGLYTEESLASVRSRLREAEDTVAAAEAEQAEAESQLRAAKTRVEIDVWVATEAKSMAKEAVSSMEEALNEEVATTFREASKDRETVPRFKIIEARARKLAKEQAGSARIAVVAKTELEKVKIAGVSWIEATEFNLKSAKEVAAAEVALAKAEMKTISTTDRKELVGKKFEAILWDEVFAEEAVKESKAALGAELVRFKRAYAKGLETWRPAELKRLLVDYRRLIPSEAEINLAKAEVEHASARAHASAIESTATYLHQVSAEAIAKAKEKARLAAIAEHAAKAALKKTVEGHEEELQNIREFEAVVRGFEAGLLKYAEGTKIKEEKEADQIESQLRELYKY